MGWIPAVALVLVVFLLIVMRWGIDKLKEDSMKHEKYEESKPSIGTTKCRNQRLVSTLVPIFETIWTIGTGAVPAVTSPLLSLQGALTRPFFCKKITVRVDLLRNLAYKLKSKTTKALWIN